mmetsp:Transcript_8352/g.33855  ORF Transcript_8352/g.33855 Transcript_8352/m.33855 type:complete len:204 (-) Transcript_8352:3034-3645(-)
MPPGLPAARPFRHWHRRARQVPATPEARRRPSARACRCLGALCPCLRPQHQRRPHGQRRHQRPRQEGEDGPNDTSRQHSRPRPCLPLSAQREEDRAQLTAAAQPRPRRRVKTPQLRLPTQPCSLHLACDWPDELRAPPKRNAHQGQGRRGPAGLVSDACRRSRRPPDSAQSPLGRALRVARMSREAWTHPAALFRSSYRARGT